MDEYKKTDIALIQLKSAIKLYEEKDYVSALTLAGAASEILTSICRNRDLPFHYIFAPEVIPIILEKDQENREKLNNKSSSKKPKERDILDSFIKQTLNKSRNELKHHNTAEDYRITAELWKDCLTFIHSAVSNYEVIFGKPPNDPLVKKFIANNFH